MSVYLKEALSLVLYLDRRRHFFDVQCYHEVQWHQSPADRGRNSFEEPIEALWHTGLPFRVSYDFELNLRPQLS